MNYYFRPSFKKSHFILAYKTVLKNRNSQKILNQIVQIYKNTDPYKKEKYVTRNLKQ